MTTRDVKHELDHCMPAAYHVKLGALIESLILAHNDLRAQYVALLAKLDADAGVTDTNYTALESPTLAALADLSTYN